MNTDILYRPCPVCNARSIILMEIDNDLPALSPSGAHQYFCPHCLQKFALSVKQEEREPMKSSFKREIYHVGGADVISYELTDPYGHCCQLDPSEAMELLTWLDTLRGQIMRDMHPESVSTEEVSTNPYQLSNGFLDAMMGKDEPL